MHSECSLRYLSTEKQKSQMNEGKRRERLGKLATRLALQKGEKGISRATYASRDRAREPHPQQLESILHEDRLCLVERPYAPTLDVCMDGVQSSQPLQFRREQTVSGGSAVIEWGRNIPNVTIIALTPTKNFSSSSQDVFTELHSQKWASASESMKVS